MKTAHRAPRVARQGALGQETNHWGRACAGGTGAEGGIGVGNHLLGQVNSLPQCTVTYLNAGARPPPVLSAPWLLRAPTANLGGGGPKRV